MDNVPKDINEYLRLYAGEMAERIAQNFPPLYRPGDPIPAEIERLRRKPYPRANGCDLRCRETVGRRSIGRRRG